MPEVGPPLDLAVPKKKKKKLGPFMCLLWWVVISSSFSSRFLSPFPFSLSP